MIFTSKYSKCPKRVSSFVQNTFTKAVKPVINWLDHDVSSSLLADSLSIVLFPIYLQYHPDGWADPSHHHTIHFSLKHLLNTLIIQVQQTSRPSHASLMRPSNTHLTLR